MIAMRSRSAVICAGLFAAFLPAFCGCDMIYRLLQKEGAEEKEILGELVPLEANPQVEYVQKLLKLYGYKVGRVDGVLGGNTRDAIAEFQKDNNLKVSRFMDKATWAALKRFESCGLVVNGELNVAAVQQALTAFGLNPGAVDGKRGRRTEAAIKEFQRRRDLKPDGRVGFKTLVELSVYLPTTED
jgi:peptidoglycan hydrolase-like protein with peptidoglycan-binding domain